MGLRIAYYKTNTLHIDKISNKINSKEFEEIEPVERMIQNYFGILPDSEEYDHACQLLTEIGVTAYEDFWLEQTLMNAAHNSQWNNSHIQYYNPKQTKTIRSKGFIIVTEETQGPEVQADITIPNDWNEEVEEIIDEIRRSTKKTEDSQRME